MIETRNRAKSDSADKTCRVFSLHQNYGAGRLTMAKWSASLLSLVLAAVVFPGCQPRVQEGEMMGIRIVHETRDGVREEVWALVGRGELERRGVTQKELVEFLVELFDGVVDLLAYAAVGGMTDGCEPPRSEIPPTLSPGLRKLLKEGLMLETRRFRNGDLVLSERGILRIPADKH